MTLNRYRIPFLILISCVLASAGLSAQTVRTDSLEFSVFFRQGLSEVDLNYRDNGKNLQDFADTVATLLEDPLSDLKHVYIEGAASPEGASDLNVRLAGDRARNIKKWLVGNTVLTPGQISTGGVGADWAGLARLVAKTDWEYRDTVCNIIRTTPVWIRKDGVIVDGLKKRLMELNGGTAWNWMYSNLFPELRQGGASVKCYITRAADPVEARRDTVVMRQVDTVYVMVPAPAPTVYIPTIEKDLLMAVRTNLLAPLMNFGVEVPLGNRWSVGGDWYYTWLWRHWSKELDMTNCMQLLGGGLDVRYWLGESHAPGSHNRANRLLGHSVGADLYGGYYDFERDFKGYQGEYFGLGFDYKYTARLNRRRYGLRMEFTIGVGYIHSDAREYKVFTAGGDAIRTGATKNINWFGPTKAGVSLVIPITRTVVHE